jgi:hypothetical protein
MPDMWPSEKATDYKGTGPLGSKSQLHDNQKRNLKGEMLPTPTSSMMDVYNTETTNHDTWVGLRKHGITGQLSPRWVEWLMGFPTEWTALEPSEMP